MSVDFAPEPGRSYAGCMDPKRLADGRAAILAAILLPVFARARENARRTQCLNNCKQIGTAIMQYTQDYDERLPYAQWTPPTWQYLLVTTLDPYMKSKAALVCPSDAGGNATAPTISYGFNEYLWDPGRNWNTLAAISNAPAGPASVSMVADSSFRGIYNDWDYSQGQTDGMYRLRYTAGGTTSRHGGTVVTYCDGHSKFIPIDRIAKDAANSRQRPIVNPGWTELP